MPLLPPPSSKNMTYDQADWNKRNMAIDRATILHCQFHVLPASFQIKLLNDPKDWKAITKVVWIHRLMGTDHVVQGKDR